MRRIVFAGYQRMVQNRRVRATVDGVVFDLDLGETIDLALYLRQFERDVIAAIDRYCPAGGTVLDVGANIGVHALRFARLVGPGGSVYAFEPTDFAFAKLTRNMSLNSFAQLVALKLALAENNERARTVDFRSSWRTDGKTVTSGSLVDLIRLDDWAERMQLKRLDLIKLDVDGNEYSVLAGGLATLGHFRPLLLMEVGDYHFADETRNPIRLLEALRYSFHDLAHPEQEMRVRDMVTKLAALRADGLDSMNILCRIPEL